MIRALALIAALGAGLGAALPGPEAKAQVLLSDDEIARTLSFGPWPPQIAPDPSNRFSGNPEAAALGAALFADPVLSIDGGFSCASCHQPARNFSSPAPRAAGRETLARNSPSVQNLASLRWYGWGGKSDNLWAASLHPLVAGGEMGHSPASLKTALLASPHRAAAEALWGPLPAQDPEAVLVNTAKTLAAYQETLVTAPAPFDRFRDALAEGDMPGAARFDPGAQRGLKLFLGRGNCAVCHSGPRFTNNEFHDAGVPYFLSETEVDPGRFAGLQSVLQSPYTLAGPWSDDPDRGGAWAVQNVRQGHADFGTFKTPGLRGAAHTAPYMHDGSLADLRAVVQHYNTIDLERMHADGEAILAPLGLSAAEIDDLVAFLRTLSAP